MSIDLRDKAEALTTPFAEATVLVASGNFGAGAALSLRVAIQDAPDVPALVVDLSDVDLIDDHGINALLGAAHRVGASGRLLVIKGASRSVRLALRSVGLHHWAAIP